MPYFKFSLKIKNVNIVIDVLSAFAKEHYNASGAYPINERHFNIDSGWNDVRASQQLAPKIFALFYRYTKDIISTETKIQIFAKNHPINCKLFDIEIAREQRSREPNNE